MEQLVQIFPNADLGQSYGKFISGGCLPTFYPGGYRPYGIVHGYKHLGGG
jgi:hypothetical protein